MLSLSLLKATANIMHDQKQELPSSGSFGLVKISGLQAKKFLQGQLTCNLEEVTETESRLGAHCNPQGRVLFLFRILYHEETYYLVLPQTMVDLALRVLKKYAIFFKLMLGEAQEEAKELRARAAQEWRYFDLSQGIPQIYPETSALFLPHELNLHQLGGLSWDKGCYTGQEIIARMHYRGKLKNHLYRAHIQTSASPRLGGELYFRHLETVSVVGSLVDYRQISYNLYQLLVLTPSNYYSKVLGLDPQQNEIWEWLE